MSGKQISQCHIKALLETLAPIKPQESRFSAESVRLGCRDVMASESDCDGSGCAMAQEQTQG